MIEQWLKNPQSLGVEALTKLPAMIGRHPYCATYRVLYLTALANVHSTGLREEIKRNVPAIPDRLKLFKLINKGEYEWVALMHWLEEQRKRQPEANDFELIERFLDNIELGSSPDVQYSLEHMPDLKTERDEQDDLIDSFLEAEAEGHLFVPDAQSEILPDDENDDIEKIKDRAFLTESLAKVYVKQGKYEQALAIFLELNLKFSKKNSYFADQIRYLQKVIELKKTDK